MGRYGTIIKDAGQDAAQPSRLRKTRRGLPKLPDPKLRLREVLTVLEIVEINLSRLIRRWGDGVPAEVRAEVAVGAYEPILRLLIRGGRRPTGKEHEDA